MLDSETAGGEVPAAAGPPPEIPAAAGPTAARRRPGWRQYAMVVLAGLALGALVVLVAPLIVRRFEPHLYAGTVLQARVDAPAFDGLSYATGGPVDLAALRGDVVLVYFGYTNCPDECPATLSAAARAVGRLTPAQQARVTVLMVTIDPARDDPASLQRFVTAFNPGFRGAWGSDEATTRVASLYGVYYQVTPGAGGPEVVHTSSLAGIGPDGKLRVVWPTNVPDDALASDLAALLKVHPG